MSYQYANLYTEESDGPTSVSKTISFPWPAKVLKITNDSATQNIKWKFKSSHPWATLYPEETVSLDCSIEQLILEGVNYEYRVWALG
jgi:hypothetical protein